MKVCKLPTMSINLTNEVVQTCQRCNKDLTKMRGDNRNRHILNCKKDTTNEIIKIDKRIYVCPYCSNSFNDGSNFSRHLHKKHVGKILIKPKDALKQKDALHSDSDYENLKMLLKTFLDIFGTDSILVNNLREDTSKYYKDKEGVN